MSVIVKSGGGSGKGLFVWKRLTAKNGNFLDYVTANSETKYPDKAVHTDGYYYEKVIEGLDLSATEITKCEVGSFEVASNSTTKTITHSLGVIPKIALCFNFDVTGSDKVGIVSVAFTSAGTGHGGVVYNGGGVGVSTSSNLSANTTSVTFATGSTSRYFASGATYGYILLA